MNFQWSQDESSSADLCSPVACNILFLRSGLCRKVTLIHIKYFPICVHEFRVVSGMLPSPVWMGLYPRFTTRRVTYDPSTWPGCPLCFHPWVLPSCNQCVKLLAFLNIVQHRSIKDGNKKSFNQALLIVLRSLKIPEHRWWPEPELVHVLMPVGGMTPLDLWSYRRGKVHSTETREVATERVVRRWGAVIVIVVLADVFVFPWVVGECRPTRAVVGKT